MSRLADFASSAKGLARNPLGIVALFIVLIYGFASLVVGLSGRLGEIERVLLVSFLVVFPILVLAVFAWLVSRHHTKLYAPTDYRDDVSFLNVAARQTSLAANLVVGVLAGRWLLPEVKIISLILLALLLGFIAMLGDLFESMLKRQAQVKDASSLLPGHGGMLDRLDSLLFAAPALVYARLFVLQM